MCLQGPRLPSWERAAAESEALSMRCAVALRRAAAEQRGWWERTHARPEALLLVEQNAQVTLCKAHLPVGQRHAQADCEGDQEMTLWSVMPGRQ